MFNKKLKKEIEYLKLQIECQGKAIQENWKYIQALLDAEKQNRKELNTVIAKINQMKTLDAEKQNRKELNTVIAKINQMKTKGKK